MTMAIFVTSYDPKDKHTIMRSWFWIYMDFFIIIIMLC